MGSNNEIAASANGKDCTVSGVPTNYEAGKEYTIQVPL